MVRQSKSALPGLVVTRTPLRVSFAGGGTDLADFYERGYGAVLSTAIDKYVYVTVKRHATVFNEPIRVNYSKSEQVHEVDQIENNIVRECLRFLEIGPPVYISTVGDLPASTGLGGSSSFAVGLLNALHAYRGERVTAGQLAEEASHIEIDILKQPIGKQDQYASAFGGLNFFSFLPGGNVTVEPQRVPAGVLRDLFGRLLMFWTGHQRDTETVLAEQKANTSNKMAHLSQMRDHAHQLRDLMCDGSYSAATVGQILDESWRLKRELASTITTSEIDTWYGRAMDAGADGGKICGAGGGGCLLFVVDPERQPAVRRALHNLTELPIDYEVHGSHVIVSCLD